MSKTAFQPRFRPVRTFTHPIMGRMDYYVIRRNPKSDGAGAQATFFRNNARPNRKGEYGIKLFPTAAEAFAAYQRQKMAADAGLAPPVRRMVKVLMRGQCWCYNSSLCKHKGLRYWYGYQTCLAYGIGKIEVDHRAELHKNPKLVEQSGIRALFSAIIRISTQGTQKDFAPLGESHRKRGPRMSNDLHCDNLGFWRKTPVVIDFGSHLVGAYR